MNLLGSESSCSLSFPDLFANMADEFSSSPALMLRGKSMTYAELDFASDNLAHRLLALGVHRDELVGVCMPRSFEMIIGMLAIMKAGGAYVPIDPLYPQSRIDYILEDSGVNLVLSLSSVELNESRQRHQWMDLDRFKSSDSSLNQNRFQSPTTSNHLAYVIYTSGSTGKPKGVMIEQGSVANLLLGLIERIEIDSHERWLGIAPIVFDASVGDWMACLASGGCYLIPDEKQVDDPFTLAEMVNTVQVVVATPSRWKQIIAAGWQGNPDLTIMCGGEPLTESLLADLIPRCRNFWNCYGPTEATVWSLARRVQELSSGGRQLYIGGTLPNYRHFVLDEQNQPVAAGQVGELCIAGAGLARAYLNKPELTAEKFIQLDIADGPSLRVYKTGDLVRQVESDQFAFIGRADDQIKIRGYRVELGEIESQLRNLPNVRDAVVVYTQLDGDDDRVLIAYLEMPEFGTLNPPARELMDELEQRHKQEILRRVPDYMVPAMFIYLESFPLTANGKVDKKSLPQPKDVMRARRVIEPRTPTQKKLAQIWARLFPGRQLGITDSFFSLGGNSLLAVSLVNEVRSLFDFSSFNMSEIMEYSTIEQLETLIELNTLRQQASRRKATDGNDREVITL